MIGDVLLALATVAAPTKLPPVDECAADPTFTKFRTEFRSTIARHDVRALLNVVTDDIMFSFDGSEGKAKFAHLWLLDGTQKDRSPIWAELETAMSLGCARVDNAFLMPSLSEQLPDVDVFEKLLALPGAQLKQDPRGDSRLIATLEYDLVLFDEDNDTDGWQKVALSDGRKGYVLRSQLRTALEYRAQFEKVNGRWRLTSFAEGD